jgi:hypothetical protein
MASSTSSTSDRRPSPIWWVSYTVVLIVASLLGIITTGSAQGGVVAASSLTLGTTLGVLAVIGKGS